jgi:hypothetical protein
VLFRHLLLAAILIAAGAAVVIPFAVGYIKGPAAGPPPPDGPGVQLLRPLTRVVTIYGRFLVLYVFAELFRASYGSFSGRFPIVCASTPANTSGGGGSGLAVRAGAVLHSDGTVQVCAAHPTIMQWFLYGLIRVPGLVVWIIALLLAWQLIRQAARGPFSRQSAAIMRRLGLVIVAGTAIAAAISGLSSDLMDRMLLISGGYVGGAIPVDVLLYEPLKAMLPWPALAGAALLSFAGITRVGADMDEEVRATV